MIYFIYIEKIQQPNFIIILDEFFTINGFTETTQVGSNFTIDNNYGLTHLIIGYHIGMIIPEIIFQLNYSEEKKSFDLLKNNMELKGNLYQINSTKNLDLKFDKVIDVLKEKKISNNKKYSFEEYDDYIKELNRQNSKVFSIFFKIVSHSFIGGKYKYYRIYVINDLLSDIDNPLLLNSYRNSESIEENNNLKENIFQSKIKNINEESSIYGSEIKSITKKRNRSSKTLIKLKTKINRQSKILIKREIAELNKELNNKEIFLKEDEPDNKQSIKQINSNINKNEKNLIQTNNSDSTLNQVSLESAEFNKLKNEIINKNDSFYIKLMKSIVIFFMILIILLIILDFMYTAKPINSIIEYFQENLYFIHSKICSACLYNSALNLKFVKEKIIPNTICPNKNCTLFYSDLLKQCYTELRFLKYNLSSFFPDYLAIFHQKLNLELLVYNSTSIEYLNLDIDMFLNFIIGNALKIIANLTNYFDNNESPSNKIKVGRLNIYLKNLLNGAHKYFYSDYDGFSGEEKELKCFQATSDSSLRVIISQSLFVISSIIIFYLICKKKGMELYFLDKLINFSSSNFDEYLKNLEELKNKFRNDSNDEEDKNMDELEIGIDEKDEEGKNENNSKINENEINIKRKLQENPNKKKNKQNKLQQQRLKKKKIMSDYFIKYNLYFGLKISFLFLVSTMFFIATLGSMEIMKKNYKFSILQIF